MNLPEFSKPLSNDDIEVITSLRTSLDEYMHHPVSYTEFLENEFIQENCDSIENIPITIKLLWEQNQIMGNKLLFSIAALLFISNFSSNREVLNIYLAKVGLKAKELKQFRIDADFLMLHVFCNGKLNENDIIDVYDGLKNELESEDYWQTFFNAEIPDSKEDYVHIGFPNDDEIPVLIKLAREWDKKIDVIIGDIVFFRAGDLYLRTSVENFAKINKK